MKNTQNIHHQFYRIAVILLIASIAMVGIFFIERLFFELMGPMSPDSHIYAAVGRGILNGLTPYEHMWESKPPGMFVLSAISLWMRGDLTIASAMQVVALLSIPLTMTITAYRHLCIRTEKQSALLLLTIVAASVFMGLYTSIRSGQFQTESFGAVLILLYISSIIYQEGKMTAARTGISALFLMLGIGFKEPFFLTAMASALFVCRTRKHFIDAFVIPFLLAALCGVVVMGIFGWLQPYVNIYLPEILGKNIHGVGRAGEFEPLLARGLRASKIVEDISKFSFFFSLFIIISIGVGLIHKFRSEHQFGWYWLCAMSLFVMYITTLAVGMGGAFWTHHFIFALPVLCTAILYATMYWHQNWSEKFAKYSFSIAVACLAIAAFQVNSHASMESLGAHLAKANEVQMAAHQIDEILYRCFEERYLFLGHNGQQPYAYTVHSPYGPVFQQNNYWVSKSRPKFRQEFLVGLSKTPIIVESRLRLDDMNADTRRYIQKNFQEHPWRCARDYQEVPPYKIWFRKGIH